MRKHTVKWIEKETWNLDSYPYIDISYEEDAGVYYDRVSHEIYNNSPPNIPKSIVLSLKNREATSLFMWCKVNNLQLPIEVLSPSGVFDLVWEVNEDG